MRLELRCDVQGKYEKEKWLLLLVTTQFRVIPYNTTSDDSFYNDYTQLS